METLKNEPVATPCVFSCQVQRTPRNQISNIFTYCNQSDGEGQDYCWSCDCLPHQGDPDHQRAQVLLEKTIPQIFFYFFVGPPNMIDDT